jgi:ribosomal protein L11 methylase PrmA
MTRAARLTCDEPTAKRVASFLAESLDTDEVACAAFESDGGQWQVAIHSSDGLDEQRLRELFALAAGEDAARELAFETVAEADWVKRSLEGLTPVRALRVAAPYDMIFANILLGPLVRLAQPIRRLSAPGAHVILSGLLPSHANAALAAYAAQGFVLRRRIPLDGWMTLLLQRPHCARPTRG